MDLNSLLQSFLALAGVAALVAALVNVGKVLGWVDDGSAPTAALVLNVIGFVVFVALNILKFPDIPGLDGIAASLAQLIMILLGLFTQLGLTKTFHLGLRGTPLIGYSYTLKAKSR